MTKRIVVVGCAFWDTIVQVDEIPRAGKVLPTQAVQNASGMATVAAITVARLGHPVALWSRLGDDPTGDLYRADLARDAVDAAAIRRVPGGQTWFSTILVDRTGERLVVAYAPPLDPDPSWLPLGAIRDAALVLSDMRWPEATRAAFAEARRHGVPTVLDADVAPPERLRELAGLADHVLFSEHALASLAPGAPPEEAVRRLAETVGAAVVGVTLGPQGAVVWESGPARLHRVPAERITVRDTLNAGDVWHGAYACGLAQGWDLPRILRTAGVAAAMKCEVFGGKTGAPTLAALEARLADMPR